MTVVRIPPTLRDETGGQAALQARGATVRELLDDLTERFPALRERIYPEGELAQFVNVYVEGEDVRTQDGLDTSVENDATVILLPAMAGGRLAPLASARSQPAKPVSAASARWRRDGARAGLVVTLRRVAFAPRSLASFASERPGNRG